MRPYFALLYTIHRSLTIYACPPLPLSRARVNLVKVPDLHPPAPFRGSGRSAWALARLLLEPHVLESFSYYTSVPPRVPSHRKTCRLRSKQKSQQAFRLSNPAIWIPPRKSSPMPCGRESSILSSTTTSASSRNCAAGTPKRSRDFVKPSLFNLITALPACSSVPACWRSEKMPTPCANLIAPSPCCRK